MGGGSTFDENYPGKRLSFGWNSTVAGIQSADTLTDKARVVLEAVADGRVPPDIGAQLVTAIGTVARVAEVDELLRRIEALEKRNEST